MSTFALILPIFSAMTFSVSSSGLCSFSFYRVSLVLSNHVLFVVFGRIFLKIRHLYSHSIFFLNFLPSLFGMILVWFVTCTVLAVSLERRGIHKLYAPLCSPQEKHIPTRRFWVRILPSCAWGARETMSRAARQSP
jgi:hypothetical protein